MYGVIEEKGNAMSAINVSNQLSQIKVQSHGDACTECRPIYIAGLERSGTSLIFALLASHPMIAMTRRTNLWTHFYNQYGDISQPKNFDRCLAMLMRYKRMKPLQLDPERIRQEFWQGERSYARLFALIEGHYAERLGKPRWGDKSLNTERYAEAIFTAYPNARILHMIRDPRDRYASALTRWKVSRGGVGAGTVMWLASVNLARHYQVRYPDQYKIIRYETLASQPEETLREICAFIGEAYTPVMLSMTGAEMFRDEGGNSSYGQHEVGHISTRSIGRFRKVLSRRQIKFMQMIAGREMRSLGYQLDETYLSLPERTLFSLIDIPFNVARMTAWRVREAFWNQKGRPVPHYRIVSETGAAKTGA